MIFGLGYSAPEDALSAFAYSAGPRDASTIILGEAWGESEERTRVPFAGASGREFARMMIEAGYDDDDGLALACACQREQEWLLAREQWLVRHSIMMTNTFVLRPSGNNLGHLCAGRAEVGADYAWPQVRNENPRYVKQEFFPHLARLAAEIDYAPRNLILALGGTASWALLGTHSIGRVRGAVSANSDHAPCKLARITKVLPTYHPASVFRNWTNRVIVLADLIKARREREFSHVERPARKVLINPTRDQVWGWVYDVGLHARILACDIETHNGQIRCIGFASSAQDALVIPFIRDASGASYWANSDEEFQAWGAVRELLESGVPKVFQNGLFDLQYLSRVGIRPRALEHDTMLLHHVLYPELPKNLAFLGSIYTNEAAWKIMRRRKKEEELKRDE